MRRPRNNSAREPATQARQTPKALLRCEQTHSADPWHARNNYRQHALECLRLANDTHESGTKAALIDMAQAWIKLAEQAQRNRQLATNQDALERPVPIA